MMVTSYMINNRLHVKQAMGCKPTHTTHYISFTKLFKAFSSLEQFLVLPTENKVGPKFVLNVMASGGLKHSN